MARDGRRLLERLALRDVNSLAASVALKEDLNGTIEQKVRLSLV
jgi:hypothetical protein